MLLAAVVDEKGSERERADEVDTPSTTTVTFILVASVTLLTGKQNDVGSDRQASTLP